MDGDWAEAKDSILGVDEEGCGNHSDASSSAHVLTSSAATVVMPDICGQHYNMWSVSHLNLPNAQLLPEA